MMAPGFGWRRWDDAAAGEDRSEPARTRERIGAGAGNAGEPDYEKLKAAIETLAYLSDLKPGDACPECQKGKVYLQKGPQVLVGVVGQMLLEATVYRLQNLLCKLCGEVFTAEAPPGV